MESNSSHTAVVKEPAFQGHVRKFFLLKKLRLFYAVMSLLALTELPW